MQYTIYIRNSNNEYFKEEENKSQLVNELLAKHYEGTPGPLLSRETPQTGRSRNPDLYLDLSKGTSVSTIIPKLTEVVNKRARSVPTCKVHGTPLDSRGKCLQKGCKYA